MPQPSFLAASFYVAGGGAFGSWLRFLVGRGWTATLGPLRAGAFPYGTLTENILGSLAMGLFVGWLARSGGPAAEQAEASRLLIAVGLLGGFTTFSSFSLDVVSLIGRGEIALAISYTGLSLVAGVGGLFLGILMMRSPV